MNKKQLYGLLFLIGMHTAINASPEASCSGKNSSSSIVVPDASKSASRTPSPVAGCGEGEGKSLSIEEWCRRSPGVQDEDGLYYPGYFATPVLPACKSPDDFKRYWLKTYGADRLKCPCIALTLENLEFSESRNGVFSCEQCRQPQSDSIFSGWY